MSWISTQFSKYWRYIHLGAVVVLAIFLLFAPINVAELICQPFLGGLYYPFFQIKNTTMLIFSRAEEEYRLRSSLTEASLHMSFLEEAVRENKRLRSALGFEPPSGYKVLPAEVVSVSGYRLPTGATINRGIDDSVRVNQPIINQDGLIGRVAATNTAFAVVQLLTDPANRVAARVASSREMGIVKYTVSDGLILDNFPIHGTIAVGDTIISSGLGGVYPPGLKVGFVSEVVCDEARAFCSIRLVSAANFHSLEEIFVLQPGDQR